MVKKQGKLPDISSLEQDLLSLLKYNSKLYGLQFIKAVKACSAGERSLGFGSLYPTLQRLQRKKLVTSDWGDQDKGPRRRYYSLTELGRQVLLKIESFRSDLEDWRPEAETELLPDVKALPEASKKKSSKV